MTTMTIIDVCNVLYPGQIDLGNIAIGFDGTNFFISTWTVPDVEEPTIDYLLAQIPILQKQFDINYFKNITEAQLSVYIDQVSNQRLYDNAVSCASYINSSITQWVNEATTFIAWRDNVFTYMIAQIALMQSDDRSVPTFDEFITELPSIIWP